MKDNTQRVGRRGEEEACEYLRSLGQTILDRNWRSSHLEIDVITSDPEGLHFVEVKSRTAPAMAEPQLNVGPLKQKRIVKAALSYVHKGGGTRPDQEIFFDIITVVFYNGHPEIEYYPKAFIPIYV